MPLLSLQSVSFSIAKTSLFQDVELHIHEKERLCIIGRNGSGKSTLLRMIAGDVELDVGSRICQPNLCISLLEQNINVPRKTQSVFDYVAEGRASRDNQTHKTEAILDQLRLAAGVPLDKLSGGELRRAGLARALVSEPDLLLLDEPTNHLDVSMIEWLEFYINKFAGAVVFVSHDRAFLNTVSRKVGWLNNRTLLLLDSGFDYFDSWSEKIEESHRELIRQKNQKLRSEERWLLRGVTARRKRNQRRLRNLQVLRREKLNKDGIIDRGSDIKIAVAARGGNLVIEAKKISKQFNGKILFKDLSTRVMRGDRIALIGPNGTGKTSLLRVLLGDLVPDTGTVELGSGVKPVYFDQQRKSLNYDQTLLRTMCPNGGDRLNVGGRDQNVTGYLQKFLFDTRKIHSLVGTLSGGERNRLMLALLFARPSNLLALDEPTNDLDVETLDVLQEAIGEYSGTVVLISHDRDFIDRVATSTIVMGGSGVTEEYIGGYTDYLGSRTASDKVNAKKQKRKSPNKNSIRTQLGYKDQRELESLTQKISVLSQKLSTLELQLADSQYYFKDPNAFRNTTSELAQTRELLTASEERWLELEEKKEYLQSRSQS